MGGGRRQRLTESIKKTRGTISALLEKRSASRDRDNLLQAEFGFDTRGPYVARYLFLVAKLLALYIARLVAALLPEK